MSGALIAKVYPLFVEEIILEIVVFHACQQLALQQVGCSFISDVHSATVLRGFQG